jgi:4-amino-4-deoxy-L-arabinose transferase-like glycosyltransferase
VTEAGAGSIAAPERRAAGPSRLGEVLDAIRRERLAYLALGFVALAAIVLRFWDLGSNPGGLYGDEAAEGLDAWRLLHQPGFHADFGVWFTSDGGREALFAYVVAAVFQVFGATVLALRATAAAFGVADVLLIGHLGRRFGIWVGVVAATWAAGSLWLIAVDRDGMRNAMVPAFGAVAMLALLRWADRPGRGSAALAGAVTSLAALYTYQPLKLLPVLVVVWVWWLRRVDRATYERLRSGLVFFVGAFLVVAAPMILVALTNPTNYFGRVASTSPFNPDVNVDSNPLVHLIRTIGMFGLTGDPNARHDVAALPLLPMPLTVVAAAGIWRLWRNRGDPGHALFLWSLPVFLAAPLLAIEGGSPHFLRALGLAAPLGVTIGLGGVEIVERSRRWGRSGARAAAGALAVLLVGVALWSGAAYLGRPAADRYGPYSYQIVDLAAVAAGRPGAAVITDSYSAMTVQFLDAANPPVILDPHTPIADPGAHSIYFALSLEDIRSALGPTAANRAQAVAWDPSGKPSVWAVAPVAMARAADATGFSGPSAAGLTIT